MTTTDIREETRSARFEDRTSRVKSALLERGAHVVRHSRWSLYQHLAGTYAILEAWQQPDDVCIAGLLHSIYSTDAFTTALFGADERAAVAAIAGAEAERLVFLFCATDRRELLAAAESEVRADAPLLLRDRRNGALLTVSPLEAGHLCVLHMANAAEQSCARDGSPGLWLADAARLGASARGRAAVMPPLFDDWSSTFAKDAERVLRDTYVSAMNDGAHAGDAAMSLAAAAGEHPYVGEPFVWLGLLAFASGDAAAADSYGVRGELLLHQWNTPWDKRLSGLQWLTLANFLRASTSFSDAECAFFGARLRDVIASAGGRPEMLYAKLEALDALPRVAAPESPPSAPLPETLSAFADFNEFGAIPDRFANYLTGMRENEQQPGMRFYPDLTAKPWWDSSQFPLARDLERMAPEIAAEFRALDGSYFHQESERIRRTGSWNVMLLFERGKKHEERCRLLPTTTSIIESHPTVQSHAGLIYFSRLAPGTVIAPHRGPTNMRLRCHLGLDIPDQCGITVGGESRAWQPGRTLVFDDSFVHDAWNRSERERVVLIVDFWHPDLSEDEIALLNGLQRHTASVAAGLVNYWKCNDDAERMSLVD